jgi:hypothetical protein
MFMRHRQLRNDTLTDLAVTLPFSLCAIVVWLPNQAVRTTPFFCGDASFGLTPTARLHPATLLEDIQWTIKQF